MRIDVRIVPSGVTPCKYTFVRCTSTTTQKHEFISVEVICNGSFEADFLLAGIVIVSFNTTTPRRIQQASDLVLSVHKQLAMDWER
jgi:hypothetical protein